MPSDKECAAGVDTPYGKKLSLSEDSKKMNVENLEAMEKKLYPLLLEGFTLEDTAKKLGIDVTTATICQTAIFHKLLVHTNAELIMNYYNIDKNGKEKKTSANRK